MTSSGGSNKGKRVFDSAGVPIHDTDLVSDGPHPDADTFLSVICGNSNIHWYVRLQLRTIEGETVGHTRLAPSLFPLALPSLSHPLSMCARAFVCFSTFGRSIHEGQRFNYYPSIFWR